MNTVITRGQMVRTAREIQKSGRPVQVITDYRNGAGEINSIRCGRFTINDIGDIDCPYERNPTDSADDVVLVLDVMSALVHILSKDES